MTVHYLSTMRARLALRRRDMERTGRALMYIMASDAVHPDDRERVSDLVEMACDLRRVAADRQQLACARDIAARGARILAEIAQALNEGRLSVVESLVGEVSVVMRECEAMK